MKGVRWIISFLRDPTGAVRHSMATIGARLALLQDRIRLTVAEALRKAARKLAFGVVAAAFALIGVGYVLIGLWFGTPSLRRLGAFFLSFTVVRLRLPNRMLRKPISTDEPR